MESFVLDLMNTNNPLFREEEPFVTAKWRISGGKMAANLKEHIT